AAAAARPAAARDAATAPAAAFPRPARGTRPRARSRDRSRAWAPRTRKSGSDTPPALAPSLLLPGRRLVRGRLVPDGGANQRPQQIAPLGALEEGGEVLVHRRIFQQPAHRPLPGLESVRDHPEIGHGRREVGGRLAHRPIALLAEQPADEPPAPDQPVRPLPEVAGPRAEPPPAPRGDQPRDRVVPPAGARERLARVGEQPIELAQRLRLLVEQHVEPALEIGRASWRE